MCSFFQVLVYIVGYKIRTNMGTPGPFNELLILSASQIEVKIWEKKKKGCIKSDHAIIKTFSYREYV